MDRQKSIKKVMELMDLLMHPGKHHDPHPWLELKLTREQLRVVFLLSFKQPVSPGGIAGKFGVPKANVTKVINSLVEKGYVRRYENHDDHRSYLLSLTNMGKQQVEKLREMRTTIMQKIMERMSDEDLNCLVVGFGALITSMKEERDENGSHKS